LYASLLACACAGALAAQHFYNYVGQIDARSALIAWGATAARGNSIGRDSTPMGHAVVRMAGRNTPSDRNWVVVGGLTPDTSYPYEIDIDGEKRGTGEVRTWPENSTHLCFFAIGDYGNGTSGQYAVADAMRREFERRKQTGCPARFVLTLGDNIYADVDVKFAALRSGDLDGQWEAKFFRPYRDIIREIPFLPTLGNHDGNGSENRGDLAVYLDNFFFPGNRPARWYTFTYGGGFAQFFGLDSTDNTETGPVRQVYAPGGEESRWLAGALGASAAKWKIPYLHHPIYNAGPRHGSSYNDLRQWVQLFQRSGVELVLSGHEHNFQYSDAASTGGILYVVSGSGGELRAGDVRRNMRKAHIAGWAASRQFLSIEIQGREAKIQPISPAGITVLDENAKALPLPILQHLP
jgi:tartrate-resistant acid phosphatase type 5